MLGSTVLGRKLSSKLTLIGGGVTRERRLVLREVAVVGALSIWGLGI